MLTQLPDVLINSTGVVFRLCITHGNNFTGKWGQGKKKEEGPMNEPSVAKLNLFYYQLPPFAAALRASVSASFFFVISATFRNISFLRSRVTPITSSVISRV